MKHLRIVTFTACALFALSACSGTPGQSGQKAPNKEDIKNKTELVIAVGEASDGIFDPKDGWGTHGQQRLTHSTLLKYDKDLKAIGDLADKWQVSEDGLTWQFTIKKDVKFSDGTLLTPEDVAFTYNLIKKDGAEFDLSFLKEVKTQGEDQVIFTLEEPRSIFISQLSEIGIVPAKTYGPNYSKNPIGSGPYVVKEYKPGEQLIFEENPNYTGEKPHFKTLTMLLMGQDGALAAAKAGQVDIAYVPPSLAEQKIEGMTLQSFDSVDVRGITMPTLPAGNTGKILGEDVPVGNDVTSELSIRKALAIGLDRKELVNVALAGRGKPAYSAADDTPWYNPETAIEDGNVKKAQELLAADGWKDTDSDGILEKNGKKAQFKLYYTADDQLRSDLSLAVAAQAKKIGIDIETVGGTWDDIFKQGKANAVMWGGGSHNPAEMYSLYSASRIDQGYDNMPQYNNPTVEKYMKQALLARNQDEANEFWKKAQWDGNTGFATSAQAPIIWLARLEHDYFVRDGLDLGEQLLHSHGYEWQLFSNVVSWRFH